MKTLLKALLLLSPVAVVAGAILVPSGSGACEPCQRLESGERWSLEIEEWTVDGQPTSLPATDAGFTLENPYTDGNFEEPPPPDVILEARLFDPAAPENPRDVQLTRVDP